MSNRLTVYLQKSTRQDKKFMVIIEGRTVHFGASGYSDFTIHHDTERKKRYDERHKRKEKWSKQAGLYTAGFWAKWLLWNKPSLKSSIKDIEQRFNIRIISKL